MSFAHIPVVRFASPRCVPDTNLLPGPEARLAVTIHQKIIGCSPSQPPFWPKNHGFGEVPPASPGIIRTLDVRFGPVVSSVLSVVYGSGLGLGNGMKSMREDRVGMAAADGSTVGREASAPVPETTTRGISADGAHAPGTAAPTGRRSVAVDLAKGIAIVLVVVAHYRPEDAPPWWMTLNDLVSQIDVRIFFFVAGYTWHLRPGERYFGYLGRKARRLLIPYFAVAALFLGLKLVPSLLMDLANPVSLGSVANILIDPFHSYVPLLWFLYSLFCIQAVFPALHRLGPRTFPVLIAATALFGVGGSHFCLGQTLGSLPYFLFGAYAAQALHWDLNRRLPRPALALLVACAVLFLGVWWLGAPTTGLGVRTREALLGLTGVTWAVLLCQALATCKSRGLALLAYLGTLSMVIYLFHTVFESSARVAFYRLPVLRALPFLGKAIPAIAAGIFLPAAAQRLVLRLSSRAYRHESHTIPVPGGRGNSSFLSTP